MTILQKQYTLEYLRNLIQIKEEKEDQIIEMVNSGKLDIYPYTDPQSASFKLEVESTHKVCAMLKIETLTNQKII